MAESSEKEGTWSGVMDGLRKEKTIYVRETYPREKNANNLLISMGAKAVNSTGALITYDVKEKAESIVSEPSLNNTEERIIDFLRTGTFPARKIVETLKIDWSSREVTSFLRSRQDILVVEEKTLKFAHKDRSLQAQKTLFDQKFGL
ncbi:hypothetical protein [Proteiniphilum sp.]|uniref:hypothetical protein n=1 Tax=Proteiniphilum sp. TaxID=1926877 RepID=UPI0033346406